MNDLVFGKKFLEDDLTWTWLRHIQEEGVKQLGVAGVLNFLPFFRYFFKIQLFFSRSQISSSFNSLNLFSMMF